MSLAWGVDLGGTKIEAVVLETTSGEVAHRKRIPTEAIGGYDHILARIKELLDLVATESALPLPQRLGIGTPGSTGKNGLLKNSNTVCLNGKPFQADLAEILGSEVICANDANCFALAEATLGAAKGAKVVFGVIMGTGVGGGIVVNGQVINGLQGIAGEWGHIVLEPDGESCYCGHRGCVETILSGPALERFYLKQSGRNLHLKEIVDLAQSRSDEYAVATIARLMERFGAAISLVVNVLDPDVIVLGGGVGNIRELLTLGRESLERCVFNPTLETRLIQPALGDSAGVFGAAMLVGQ